MRKFLIIAMLFIASALTFGQDGRTKVNFYNQTSTTLRFMLNGSPVCTGDVIPQGFCTEPVNPSTYTASATNGSQSTGGQTFNIEDGETYNYTVTERSTQLHNTNPNLRTIALHSYHGAVADAPIDLKTTGTETSKTEQGNESTMYSGEMPNGDIYFVGVAESYDGNLAKTVSDFAAGAGGKVLESTDVTVSGSPAKAAVIESHADGKTFRFALLVAYRGNKLYIFAFGTDLAAAGTDTAAVKRFFTSAAIQ